LPEELNQSELLEMPRLAYLNKNFKDILTGGKFMAVKPLPEELNQSELLEMPRLAYLNKNFKDILTGGKFMAVKPLPEELNQSELLEMPRLAFKFNRINNGRLRQLIDYMNTR
jgi:hypothetical protein